jgi:hypothetical protein
MTPVKRHLNFLIVTSIMVILHGCSIGSLEQDGDHASKSFCGQNCDINRYKVFDGQLIHLEIEPAKDVAQVFYNIDPKILVTSPVHLSKSVHISGNAPGAEIYLVDEEKRDPHDKSASFFDILAIPLVKESTIFAPRTPAIKSRLRKDGSFDMDLLSMLSYSLVLNPNGYFDRAPMHINPGLIAGDTVLDFLVTQKLTKVTGRVVAQDSNVFINSIQSLMHARVLQGTRLVSSVGMIKSDGQFSVEISNPLFGNNDLPINLVIEPNDIEIALPKITKKLDKNQLTKDLDVGAINLGTLKKPISLIIEVHGSDDSVISNAYLYLNAKVGTGETLVKKQVNALGLAKFTHLYEGHYDIAIVPPFDSIFAMRVIKDVEFDAQEDTKISIDLHKRDVLNAEVIGHNGKPVSGALIEFSRIGEIGLFASEDIYEDMLFKLAASTNDRGQVCHRKFGFQTSNNNECSNLLLDEGRYLAHIIPPAGTELSHKWLTFDFPEQSKLSIVLDEPQILTGQIISADNTWVKRAFVTVYLAEMTLHNQPKVIGNAITDERGFFTAFVSAP